MSFVLKVVVAAVLATAIAIAHAAIGARPHPADAALVFGNTVDRGGAPSPRLAARLEAAREVYAAKLVRRVLVSGGTGKEGFDEAQVMADWLRARGVPDSALVVDPQGVNTAASCANARRLLGATRVVVVTQWFHVARARLAARRAGLEVEGAAVARYAEPRDAWSFVRELVALPVYAFGGHG
jgi:vancomycin permeability regulator SanA